MAQKSEYKNQTLCPSFIECPLCFKCRGYNLARIECQECEIPKCTKTIHNPKNINMMISRDRIKIE